MIQIRGTAETRRCVADAVRLQVITLNAPLTLHASYLPLPPQLLPLFSYLSLITVLVNPAYGIQECFNTTSFDKNYWHCNFAINLFCSSFSPLLHTRTFFAIPFAEKMHPFFLPVINPKILLSRFLLCYNFLLLFNEHANYLYRRNWNRPINPVRPCPWFYWGERQIARLATPVLWLPPLNSQHLNFQFPITLIFKFC